MFLCLFSGAAGLFLFTAPLRFAHVFRSYYRVLFSFRRERIKCSIDTGARDLLIFADDVLWTALQNRPNQKMASLTVIAGSGKVKCVDGAGTAAALMGPKYIFYSETTETLLFSEAGSCTVRSLLPCTERRKSALKQSITSALCDAVPVQPLMFLIFDYAITNSTSSADMSCVVLAR